MERLTEIVGKIAEYTVEPVVRHVRYVFDYNRFLRMLQNGVHRLDAKREIVERMIVEAEREGREVETFVTNWLTDVNKIIGEAKDFLKDEHQAKIKCLYGFCPNLMVRHHLGRKSRKLVQDVIELYWTRNFELMLEEVDALSTNDSRTLVVQNVMDELRNSNTDIIGVYGLGGVGNTILVKEIYKQATKGERLFDEVIMVLDLKQNPSIERIQKEIAEKLGLNLHEIQTPAGRARHLYNRIKDNKTLVILDDVWEIIDLEAVGLLRMPTLKILLTSRSKLVLSRDMGTQKDFRLDFFDEIELKDIEWSYSKLDNEELNSLFLLCGVVFGRSNTYSILDLLKYGMGLGLLKNVDSIGDAWDALNSLLQQLKDSCLLLDSDDNTHVRMHDLVKQFARRIASREQHVLFGARLKEWPDKEFMEKCTMINIDRCNIPKLPDVLPCQELTLFHLISSNEDSSPEIPCDFFEEMKKLRVLDLTSQSMPLLPPSLQFLKNLRTLCLDLCTLGDITLVGQLQNLEILSFLGSKLKLLPKEIGQLIRLRLLDLTGCSQLEVISPNVLSSLKRLEHLRMGNSFNRWEVGRIISIERTNANLEELKHLHQLTALQIHIPDSHTLPAELFTSKLKRFQICIGSAWKWDDVDESVNTLKLKLAASNELDQAGLKLLLEKTEDLYLEGMEGVNSIVYQLGTEGFQQQINNPHVQNSSEFAYIINGMVMLPCLSSLAVHRCNGLRFMFSSSTARSLIQLKHLEITECQMMEEIVSTEQYGEEITVNMFPQLQHLKLKDLPNLAKFCSASYIEFPSLKRLQLNKCAKLETFISHPLTKNIAIDNEIEEEDSKENPETVVKYFLFDKKVGFPRLERLSINGLTKLITIWHNQLAPNSFCALRDVKVRQCNGLRSMLVPSLMGRLGALEKLSLEECGVLEEIVAKEGPVTLMPKFLLPKVMCVTFKNLPQLKSFYPGMHASKWPLLKTLVMDGCIKVEIFATKLSSFQNTSELNGLSSPVKQSFFLIEDVMPDLTSLAFHRCDCLRFLLSSFGARSCVKLKHLEISECQVLEEIISEIEYGEENPNVIFSELEQLELNGLPNLTKFCSRSYIELSSLKTLKVVECAKLQKFIFDPLNKRIAIYKEIEGRDSTENLQTVVQHFIFDVEKIELPKLTSLIIHQCDGLSFLLSSSMEKSIVLFKHSEISECQIVEETMSAEEYNEENSDVLFSKLEQLELNDLPILARFGGHIEFPSFQRLKIVECTKLEPIFDPSSKSIAIYKETEERDSKENLEIVIHYFLFDEKVVLRNLTSLIVNRCHGLRFLLSSYMARSLVQLKLLEISECQIMEEIVLLKEYSEGFICDIFPKLKHLKLSDLPNLARFCLGSYVELPSLESLQLEKCTKLETFIHNPLSKSIEISKEILFDEKVGFPRLERLIINDLPKLRTIWGRQLAPNSFCRLRDITVQQCNSLINILPGSIARVFQRLQKLTVEECGAEEILAWDDGLETLMPRQLVFPELTCLEFKSLPQLERFCPRMFMWPLLKKLVLFDCRKVETFGPIFSSLINKISSPNLEDLTLGSVDIWYGLPSRSHFSEQAVWTIRHLKTLRLHGLEKRTRLWGENLIPDYPAFSSLDILEVKFCGMNNLELSALSFRCLTILELTFCWRLQYLTTYSLAGNFVQLKTLKIDECKGMKEILANDGDGDDAGTDVIVFSDLRHLELSDLISLERFCSANYIVKCPSLQTLEVTYCPVKLKNSNGVLVLEEDVSNIQPQDDALQKAANEKFKAEDMHLQSHSRNEQAVDITEASSCLETNRHESALNDSEGAQNNDEFNAREPHDEGLLDIPESEQGVKTVIQETPIKSQNTDPEVMNQNKEQVADTNLQEADFGMQDTLIEPLNLGATEDEQFQFQVDSRFQRISKLEKKIRHLQEELLREKESEMKDKEQKLATVDGCSDPSGS